MAELVLDRDQYVDLEKISIGALRPLAGFMDEEAFNGVVETMRLPDGQFFPFPIVLGVTSAQARAFRGSPSVALVYDGEEVGEISPESIYRCDEAAVARKVFGTADAAHPGVSQLFCGGEMFVGGPVRLRKRMRFSFSDQEPDPDETRAMFVKRGWQRIVGFATRNVPHRAHEYLQRVALEHVDGLFVQPTIGSPKPGNFTAEAIAAGYSVLIDQFFGPDRVILGFVSTVVRYGGPREALLQAIIRRNYGCTHFIIGRDHSGVDGFYGKYAAHELSRRVESELGIEIMRLHGPYYCSKCADIVTEQTCMHYAEEESAAFVQHISASDLRAMYADGREPPPHLIRTEVAQALRNVPVVIEDSFSSGGARKPPSPREPKRCAQ